jgi:hypothetical protein
VATNKNIVVIDFVMELMDATLKEVHSFGQIIGIPELQVV